MFQLGAEFGFWPVFFEVLISAWLGLKLLKLLGFQVVQQLQQKVALGQNPEGELLVALVSLIGGILLILPGVISDLLGLVCVLPFTRSFVAKLFKKSLISKIQRGQVRVFPGFSSGFRTRPDQTESPQVIDVSSERITSHHDEK